MEIPILCEILAILDFLVQGPATRSVQDSDYEEYKKEILKQIAARMRYPMTSKKIKKHLLQALRARADYPDDVLGLLLLHGTSDITLDRKSERQIDEHVKTLRLNDALGGAPRPRRARSMIPETAKQQNRALSVATSESRQSSKGCAYPSSTNRRNVISKRKGASKVTWNNLNAVHAGNTDLDSKNAKYASMKPCNLTTLFQKSKDLVSRIVLTPPFLQRRP